MLKHPKSDVNFVVSPGYFIGDFDVYDREETLGVRLVQFDPNDEDQMRSAMDEFFFAGARVSRLTAEHKAELLRVLASALEDGSYEFDSLVGYDLGDGFSLPAEWEIRDARKFFSQIYRLAVERWAQA